MNKTAVQIGAIALLFLSIVICDVSHLGKYLKIHSK
jgi:hypothetical protein